MSVSDFLRSSHPTAFSFEVLPPVRGKGLSGVLRSIDQLMEFSPAYINITTHRTERQYVPAAEPAGPSAPPAYYRAVRERHRPGTVAVAALLRERYGVPTVPHLICGEYSRAELEDQLIDLSYLGLTDLVVLRGDRERGLNRFVPAQGGHEHALSLCQQVEQFNQGRMVDGTQAEPPEQPFTYGVAGYPEKHEEAMNEDFDLQCLKEKVEAGAGYVVTQMFFDNRRYFRFVERCRQAGITVPIVPGLKPLTSLTQMSLLPKTFHIDLPQPLAEALLHCRDNDQVKQLGVEWATEQARELRAAGVPSIHFYSMNAAASVARVARAVY